MLRWGWLVGATVLVIGCGGSTDDGIRLGGAGTSSGGAGSGGAGSGGISSGGASGAGAAGAGFGGGAGPIDPPGPRLCGGRECAQGQACCLATSQCFDPAADPGACAPPPPDDDPQRRKPCSSNAHCAANEFCMAESSFICQTSGHCQPIDNCGTCGGSDGVCRVCGCDGNTYPDVQTACRAGARVLPYHGAGCGETIDFGGGGGGGRGEVPPLRVTPCGTDANCPTGQRCCAITAVCYPSDDPGRCVPPPPGTTLPCTANDQCFPGQYCKGEGCTGPGGCVSPGSEGDCGVTFEPVCGCDGITYTSAACASSRGVRVAATGECPSTR